MRARTRFAGKLNIGLPSGGRFEERDKFVFSLIDESSGIEILEFEITPEDLALGMACRAHRPIEFSFVPKIAVVAGTTYQHKTEAVEFDAYGKHVNDIESKRGTPEAARHEAAVAPYEVDGWSARLSDLQDGHRRVGTKQTVTFTRYVDPNGKPVIL